MLGGAGTHDGWVGAAAADRRETLVKNLLQVKKDHGFDGFDLDWEPVNDEDRQPLRALAEALRAAAPDMIFTLPVGWINTNFPTWTPSTATSRRCSTGSTS